MKANPWVRKKKRPFWKAILTGLIFALVTLYGIHAQVKDSCADRILTMAQVQERHYDAVMVLGAGIRQEVPTPILANRLETGVEAYKKGAAPRLLMTGDHGRDDHDEVKVMKNYALQQGVPAADIFLDHAGFTTYDSMYRAKEIFQARKILVVTQEYHLTRALYIANSLGLDADGVAANDLTAGQYWRNFREVFARIKAWIYVQGHFQPAVLGEVIPLTGSGEVTQK